MSSVRFPGWLPVIAAVILLAIVVVNIIAVASLIGGQDGVVDPDADTTFKLAEQVFETTKSLIAFGTSVLGGVAFIFSDKISTYWERSSSIQKQLVAIAACATAVSVLSGLLIMWATISASADSVVRASLPSLLVLQTMELSELAAGIVILSAVAVTAVAVGEAAATS